MACNLLWLIKPLKSAAAIGLRAKEKMQKLYQGTPGIIKTIEKEDKSWLREV